MLTLQTVCGRVRDHGPARRPGRRGGAAAGGPRLGGNGPSDRLVPGRDQSSFWIVPVPRFLASRELPLLPNRSRENVSSASRLPSPLTSIVMVLVVSPGANVSVPALAT